VQFIEEFCLEDKGTCARVKLEGSKFYQGKRSVSEYVDEFQEVVEISEYTDELGIVMKFRRGLDVEIQNAIAKSRVDRPKDNDLEGWFAAAQTLDLNRQANDTFNEVNSRRSTVVTSSGRPSPRNPFLRVPTPLSTTSLSLSTSYQCPPPRPFVPFAPGNADTNRSNAPMKCYKCNEAGHTIRDCPKRFDVRAMTVDELSEILKSRFASMDVVHKTVAVTAEVEKEPEVLEEDFVAHNE
jgi:hypothetical protein